MTDETESIVLQILKSLQAGQRELRVDVARISSTQAYHEVLLGRIGERLDRIEHRLDVIDAEAAG